MSVLPLSYYESDATLMNTLQNLTHIMADKQLTYIWYEKITVTGCIKAPNY